MEQADQRLLIVGGYGRAGREVARMLLSREKPLPITIAGRRIEAARSAASGLRDEFGHADIRAVQVDATDRAEMLPIFQNHTLVVVCVPFSVTGAAVLRAAVDADVDYVDLAPDPEKRAALATLGDKLDQTNRRFVVDAGINPGCPAFLVRRVARAFDTVEAAVVSSLYQDDHMPDGGARDMILHAKHTFRRYRSGAWRDAPITDMRRVDFGGDYGQHLTVSVESAELDTLPASVGLERLELRQAGFNWASDAILLAAGWLPLAKSSRATDLATGLLRAAVGRSSPPFGVVLQVDALGTIDGHPAEASIRLSHSDLYEATAIPVAATVDQINQGLVTPGWDYMGHAVKPDRFADQIRALGLDTRMHL